MRTLVILDNLKRSEIDVMREWLKECFEDEYDQELIDQSSDSVIVKSIERYFDGGVAAFMETL